jgi:uncharacterized protein YjbI with pentapeptide repeats
MSWRIVIISAAVGLAAVAVLLWWWVPKWQMRSITAADPKARADIEDNFRKTIGQLIGGAAVLVGAGLAYLQFTQQQQASQQQFLQQQQASRDLLISNQVSKGFEQLGSDKVVVRLGGIYALEGVMNASEQYHQPVLEALCAFVRDSTRFLRTDRPPSTDIQAALTVIGRRSAGTGRVDLTDAHIPHASLVNAKLSDAVLIRADLSNAVLIRADLSNAHLARTELSGAQLIGAHLNGAQLPEAKLSDAQLMNADLSDAVLVGAHLNGALLKFPGGHGYAKLSGAHLSLADLSGAEVSQTQLDEAACADGAKLPPGLNLKPCP